MTCKGSLAACLCVQVTFQQHFNTRTMAPRSTHLLVFGDQVIDKRPIIRNLVRNSKSSAAARRYLQEATGIVQIELAQLTPDEHGWPGSFESLLALADAHREDVDAGLFFLTSLLVSIGRFDDLIVYVGHGIREAEMC